MAAAWLEKEVSHVNSWMYRAVALLSLTTHLLLVFFSGIRRRRAYGFGRFWLWTAYQVASWAPMYVLGNLYLGDTDTAQKQQLVAFWVPFLLLHLARPDNISAYTMEDHAMKLRMAVIVPVQSLGAAYVLFRYILVDSTAGTLRPAACIMNFLGIFKYVESLFALWRGDLGQIRSKTTMQSISPDDYRRKLGEKPGQLGDEDALLLAHAMFFICKSAFSDSRVEVDRDAVQKILSGDWNDMCKVVEMELSLMYDIMYTKAATAHTWCGYAIRAASPPLTATALLLFWFRYGEVSSSNFHDVVVTYILLWTTLALDVRCLLRAVASTWTHSFLKAMPHCWLYHEFLCRGRWEKLRRFLLCPVRRLHRLRSLWTKKEPRSYRRWSGNIERHNLLYECTGGRDSLFNTLVRKIESEDQSVGPDIADRLKELLFQNIYQVFFEEPSRQYDEGQYDEGQYDERPYVEETGSTREFQEVVLSWHITTDVFLWCSNQNIDMPDWSEEEKAIKAMSDYMLFLVAVRPRMLPGLQLQSLYETTRDHLMDIWPRSKDPVKRENFARRSGKRERELANWMLENMNGPVARNSILLEGTLVAHLLRNLTQEWSQAAQRLIHEDNKMRTHTMTRLVDLWIPCLEKTNKKNKEGLLKFILDEWVRLLLYASTRCSRESHANQLSRGGELTTILWIITQHAHTNLVSENCPSFFI